LDESFVIAKDGRDYRVEPTEALWEMIDQTSLVWQTAGAKRTYRFYAIVEVMTSDG
jgi:hypothetical protein